MSKKIGIILLTIIVLVIAAVPVMAADSYEVTLEVDKTQVKPGDTVTVTVSLSSMNVAAGLGAFVGKLSYDADVFETIEQADFVGATGWGSVIYNPDGGYLAVERAAGDNVTEDTAVMVITLTVKADATIKSASIGLSEISCSNGEEDIAAANVNAVITVTQNSAGNNNNTINNNTVTGENTNQNGTSNQTTNNNVNQNTSNNAENQITNTINRNNNANVPVENTPGNTLPFAGTNQLIMPAIIILLLVGGISYIRYRKMKNL